jgi:hypothetical protein
LLLEEVLTGRITFRIDGKEVILTPSDPPLHIPRLHVHGFKFFAGEPASFSERTDPAGEFKEDFFYDIFEDGQPTFLTAMRSFYDGDTYPALGPKWLDVAYISVVGRLAKWWYPRKRAVPSAAAAATSGPEESARV